MIELFTPSLEIMEINEDVPLQVAFSLFLKNIIRVAEHLFAKNAKLTEIVVQLVRLLLRIPKEKSFESASIYAGNLAVILFDKVLGKKHNDILQEIVLKVFRSRTPSVIQSLVLVYARIINQGVTPGTSVLMKRRNLCWVGRRRRERRMWLIFFHLFLLRTGWGLKYLLISGCFSKVCSEVGIQKQQRTFYFIKFYGSLKAISSQRQKSWQSSGYRFQPFPHQHQFWRNCSSQNISNADPMSGQWGGGSKRQPIWRWRVVAKNVDAGGRSVGEFIEIQGVGVIERTENRRFIGRQIEPARKYVLHVGDVIILRWWWVMRWQNRGGFVVPWGQFNKIYFIGVPEGLLQLFSGE